MRWKIKDIIEKKIRKKTIKKYLYECDKCKHKIEIEEITKLPLYCPKCQEKERW